MLLGTQAEGTAAAPAYSWHSDADTGMLHPAADTVAFSTGGVQRFSVNPNGSISFPTLTGDPLGGVDGQAYYNSTTGKFRAYEAGTWKNMISGGGGGPGPWEITAGAGGNTWGTGVTNNGDPFNTYWHDERAQFVILASELIAAGASAGNLTGIDLRCFEVPGQDVIAFRVRLQQTAATTSTAYVAGGWTDVYGPTNLTVATFTAGSWKNFTFGVPFVWDGVSNILVDLSTDSAEWVSGGGMYARTGLVNRLCSAFSDSGYIWPYDAMPPTTYNQIPEIRFYQ
jgi:hypothetical protein